MEHKKMLMKLLEDYQPFMYNHYVQDDVKNYAYLNEVADAILNLNKAFVIKSVCDHDVRNFKDRQECEKCGEVWIRQ